MRLLEALRTLHKTTKLIFKAVLCNDPMMLFTEDEIFMDEANKRTTGGSNTLENLTTFKKDLYTAKRELTERLMLLYKIDKVNAMEHITTLQTMVDSLIADKDSIDPQDYHTLALRVYEIHNQAHTTINSIARLCSSIKSRGTKQNFTYKTYKTQLRQLSREVGSMNGKLKKVDIDVLAELDTITGKELF